MSTSTQTTWAEGTTARYLTLAAEILRDPTLTVDVTERDWVYAYTCRGCGDQASGYLKKVIHRGAQQHAEKCRAMPRPSTV
ncbi:hypothetical protein [Streptomyces endophytica]|uniref:Uncharacterized protein n=1 Tax=Streptomyces endophytica TaxID=2991496 RepID=A0ABY6PB04_9ACTN|nr:hypothetical protein [Streptomyces endophytica]UZJ31005.1 hypothetical protein OJ254_12470 [Streptomyces endophytica]